MSDNRKLLMGMGLIAAAVYMSRARPTYGATYAPASAGQQPGRGALGAGSMPGSVGTGLAQQIGGAIGNAIVKQFGGGTATGVPPTNNVYDLFPALAGDPVIQNSIPAADPMATFDPGFNLTTGYEDYA